MQFIAHTGATLNALEHECTLCHKGEHIVGMSSASQASILGVIRHALQQRHLAWFKWPIWQHMAPISHRTLGTLAKRTFSGQKPGAAYIRRMYGYGIRVRDRTFPTLSWADQACGRSQLGRPGTWSIATGPTGPSGRSEVVLF